MGGAVGDKYGRTLKLNVDATYLAVGALLQVANSSVDKVRCRTLGHPLLCRQPFRWALSKIGCHVVDTGRRVHVQAQQWQVPTGDEIG